MTDTGETYIGVKKNPDGTPDLSRAAIILTEPPLPKITEILNKAQEKGVSEQQILNLIHSLRNKNHLIKRARLSAFSREHNVNIDELKNLVLKYVSERTKNLSEGTNYHYHRTSLDALPSILETRALLARSELKKINPDINLPSWSARDEIMTTRDEYNQVGKLIKPGLGAAIGASGNGVTFVLKESVMDLPGYDAIDNYPCIPNVPLSSEVKAVLVDSESEMAGVKTVMERFGYGNISIQTVNQWRNDHYNK